MYNSTFQNSRDDRFISAFASKNVLKGTLALAALSKWADRTKALPVSDHYMWFTG